jgi:hypothetical protein
MTTTLTRGEALNTVDFAIEQFVNDMHIKQGEIETITYAVNNDLQIRDYLLGLPAEFNIQTCIDFVGYLASKTNGSESYAYETILAMYNLELGNVELAENLLAIAENFNPNYNLMKLVKRIISADWPPSALTKMRDELHLSVLNGIKEDSDYVIVEVE